MMLHSELQTSIQEGVKINVLLFDNAAFGCINNLQMNHKMGSFGTENRFKDPKTGKMSGGLVPVDFAKTLRVTAVKPTECIQKKSSSPHWLMLNSKRYQP